MPTPEALPPNIPPGQPEILRNRMPRVWTVYQPWALIPSVVLLAFGLVLGSIPFRSGSLDWERLSQLLQHPTADKELLLFWFGGYCTLFGLFLTGRTLQAILYRRRVRAAGPMDGPWAHDYDWRPLDGAPDGTLARAFSVLLMTLAISGFLVPLNLVALEEWRKGPVFPMLIVMIFNLVALGALANAGYLLARWLKFGTTRLRARRHPVFLGGMAEFEFHGGSRMAEARGLQASVCCVVSYWRQTRRGTKTVTEQIQECIFRRTVTFNTNGQGMGVIHVELPTDARGTNLAGSPPIYWEVDIGAKSEGVDYWAAFLVPVYDRQAQFGTGR